MRPFFALSLLSLSLLGACAQHDRCMVSANPDSATCSAAYMPSSQPAPRDTLQYTANLATPAANPETITVRLDHNFSSGERDKIGRAVDQWNHVLNGHARFDISSLPLGAGPATTPETNKPGTWIVAKVNGGGLGSGGAMGNGMSMRSNIFTQALAQTQPLGTMGGMVIVFADRIGSRDLTGVMMHEFGHVLGLDHDPRGRLMSTHYTSNRQACVDRAAAQAVALAKNLPLAELNWCGESLPPTLALPVTPVPLPVTVIAPAATAAPDVAAQTEAEQTGEIS